MRNTIMLIILIGLLISCRNHDDKMQKIKRFGNFRKRPRGVQMVNSQSGQSAVFIANNNNKKGKIKSIRYYIGNKGKPNTEFRVRLYLPNAVGKPEKEMLPEAVITSSNVDYGWFSVDLHKYNLDFPAEGFFAAMEWLPVYTNGRDAGDCQSLAYSALENNNITWYCSLEINWYQLLQYDYNAMIAVDIKLE